MRALRQELESMKDKLMNGEMDQLMFSAKNVAGLRVLTGINHLSVPELRKAGDLLRDKHPDVVAVLASVSEEKISILAVCGKDAVARGARAGDIIRAVTAIAGGKGGGKPDSAMGGGNDVSRLDDALAAVEQLVSEKLADCESR